MLALLPLLPGPLCCSHFVIREEALLFPFDLGYVRGFSFLGRRKNGQRYSDSGCGRSSGGCSGCNPGVQDAEESSSVAGQRVARFGASALPDAGE